MSQFKRDGKWVAKYQLDNKQVWVEGGPWPTKTAAREAERRDRDRRHARRTQETCASFADRWLEEWPRKSPATRKQYAAAAKRFAAGFGPTRLGEVERLSARTWALSQPRQVSSIVGTMYEDARNIGLVEANPFADLRLPATEAKGTITPPTMAEYRTLLDACGTLGNIYGREFRAMIQFSAWTGVRAGELQALTWSDIGPATIEVRATRYRDGSTGKPKNGRERTIAYLPPARVLDDVPRWEADNYVFHSPTGKPLVQGSHHYSWRQVRAAAGLPQFRWHDWRHFAATQLLEMGLDHFAVSIQLGHVDGGALVMSRYGHPSEDAARRRLLAAFELDSLPTGSATGSEQIAEGLG